MRLPYLPGQNTKLQWAREEYDEATWQKHKILTDIAYAKSYGFLHTRMPTPGRSLDPQAAEKRAKSIERAWGYEARTRSKGEKALPASEFPLETKLYLYERIKDIPSSYLNRELNREQVLQLEDSRRRIIEITEIQGLLRLRDENQT